MKKKIAVTKMQKHFGGRMDNVETYIAYCDGNKERRPDGWLIAKKSIKTPESDDIFGHVALLIMNNEQCVVKVYEETSPMLKPELSILKMLTERKQHNVVQFICDFSCNDTKLKWNKELRNDAIFCSGDDALHFILLEYIEDGDIHHHLGSTELTFDEMKSVLKQVGLCLLQLTLNYNINHGDIHHGNILVQRNIPEKRTYNIKNQSVTIDTYGIEPIFIDFGRAHKSFSGNSSTRKRSNNSNTNSSELSCMIDIDSINWKTQELLQTYDLIRHIVVKKKFKKFIAATMQQIESYSTEQMNTCIDYIGAL